MATVPGTETPAPPLDPEVALFLEQMAAMGAAGMTDGTVAEARAANAAFARQAGLAAVPMEAVADLAIPVAGRDVRARRYVPPAAGPATVVFFHGGGWVLGGIEGHDGICRRLAARTKATVYSVGYRLAPEDPFPAAFDDAYGAIEWVAARTDGPLVLAGDSAGGNLATVAALRAREQAGPEIALQILFYPVVDHSLEFDSCRRFGEGHLLTLKDMNWFMERYVPEPGDRDQQYVSPLRAADLAGMPDTYLAIGTHDPLRDPALAYAQRLEGAGVTVTSRLCDGHLHGFLSLSGAIPAAEVAYEETLAEVARLVPTEH